MKAPGFGQWRTGFCQLASSGMSEAFSLRGRHALVLRNPQVLAGYRCTRCENRVLPGDALASDRDGDACIDARAFFAVD